MAKYTITFIVNSEDYIKQFIQQQCCVSQIEETNPTDRIWPCQIPQEKKPALCTANVELPENNASYNCMWAVLNASSTEINVIFLLEMKLTIIFKFSAS